MVEQEPQPTPEEAMGEQGDPWAANRDRMHEDLINGIANPPSGVEEYPIDPERLALIGMVRQEDEKAAEARGPDAPRTVYEWGDTIRANARKEEIAKRERIARGASAMYSPRSD